MSIATAIKMKTGSYYSNDLLEIEQIYLTGNKNGWYYKEALHDYLKMYSNSITVKYSSGPYVIPVISQKGEKYVRSTPNNITTDNLLSLPRY